MSGEVKWGPAILADGKWFLFQGELHEMPAGVTNTQDFLEKLKLVERFDWAFSIPEQRDKLFAHQLEDALLLTHSNWATHALVICAVASTIFIFITVTAEIRARL